MLFSFKNKVRKIYKKSILISFIILLLLLFDLKKNFIIYLEENKRKKLSDKLNEINKWIKICKNNILIKEISKYSEKPKITALITLYNSQNFIHIAVKSVQNQLFSDIEILIVDDGSTDNSLTIIKNLQKKIKELKLLKIKSTEEHYILKALEY